MITAISFKDFKALRDTRLELGPYNLIVGPNGSGKSTLLEGLRLVSGRLNIVGGHVLSAGANVRGSEIEVDVQWSDRIHQDVHLIGRATNGGIFAWHSNPGMLPNGDLWDTIGRARVFSLDEEAIAASVQLQPDMQLEANGRGLAGVLDRMRDEAPEAFDQLNGDIGRILPEFDRILFETPAAGMRAFMMRTRKGQHGIRAADLSQGVLLGLALLTLSYLPHPPTIIGLEEPDRGIHPRLYREIQDALYRLSYPESFGISRAPVQVIVTTHSPFMLDLHKEHPEEIVIAEKTERGSIFHRLSDRPDLVEILEDVSLGEAWYSGILGGVPAAR
jgi:predicted ATPase